MENAGDGGVQLSIVVEMKVMVITQQLQVAIISASPERSEQETL